MWCQQSLNLLQLAVPTMGIALDYNWRGFCDAELHVEGDGRSHGEGGETSLRQLAYGDMRLKPDTAAETAGSPGLLMVLQQLSSSSLASLASSNSLTRCWRVPFSIFSVSNSDRSAAFKLLRASYWFRSCRDCCIFSCMTWISLVRCTRSASAAFSDAFSAARSASWCFKASRHCAWRFRKASIFARLGEGAFACWLPLGVGGLGGSAPTVFDLLMPLLTGALCCRRRCADN
mmetsp:Transcript_60647/g.112492  ORF Transcript_60647/g.112492 Transcript_60647/m.112492 type:complete len:232 (+) Transcript_60647:182-877(+)